MKIKWQEILKTRFLETPKVDFCHRVKHRGVYWRVRWLHLWRRSGIWEKWRFTGGKRATFATFLGAGSSFGKKWLASHFYHFLGLICRAAKFFEILSHFYHFFRPRSEKFWLFEPLFSPTFSFSRENRGLKFRKKVAREPLLPLFWSYFRAHFLASHFFRSIFGNFTKKVAGEPLLPLFKARAPISKKSGSFPPPQKPSEFEGGRNSPLSNNSSVAFLNNYTLRIR